MAALITAAFGLVAALAWNDAIKALFKSVFGANESLPAMFSYAIIVTVLAVFVTLQIGRLAEKAN